MHQNNEHEEIPSVFGFLKIITDERHPAIMTITWFSFFGLLATSIFIFFLPFIDNRFGIGLLVLSFILFILLQYFISIVEKEDKKEEKKE